MTPTVYRKRPVTVEAMRYDGTVGRATEIIDWVLSNGGTARYVNEGEDHPLRYADELYRHRVVKGDRAVAKNAPAFIVIETLEGPHRANPRDQVIRGVQGEFYPVKPDIFDATHEAPLPMVSDQRYTDPEDHLLPGSAHATVTVHVMPAGEEPVGPVIGSVVLEAPDVDTADAARKAIHEALRIPGGAG